MTIKILSSNDFGKVELVSSTNSETLVIKHNACSAKVSLYGGHVLAWQPKDEKPVFGLVTKPCIAAGQQYEEGSLFAGRGSDLL